MFVLKAIFEDIVPKIIRDLHISFEKVTRRSGMDEANLKYIYNYSHDSYRKTSYISRTLVGNKIVDHSDVVGASPVGAAPTTSSFSI